MREEWIADCNKIVHSPSRPFSPPRRRPSSRARRLETELQCYRKVPLPRIPPSASRPGSARSQSSCTATCASAKLVCQSDQEQEQTAAVVLVKDTHTSLEGSDSTLEPHRTGEVNHEDERGRMKVSRDDVSPRESNQGPSVVAKTRPLSAERRRIQRPASAGSNREPRRLANLYRRTQRPASAHGACVEARSENVVQTIVDKPHEKALESRETHIDAKFRALLAQRANPLRARSTGLRAVGAVQRKDAPIQRRVESKRRASAPSYDQSFKNWHLENTLARCEPGLNISNRPTSAPSCRTMQTSQVPFWRGLICRGNGEKNEIRRNLADSGFDAWLARETCLAHGDQVIDVEEFVCKIAASTGYVDFASSPEQLGSDRQEALDGKKKGESRSLVDTEPAPVPIFPPPVQRIMFRPPPSRSFTRAQTISGHTTLKQNDHASSPVSRNQANQPALASTCPAPLASCCPLAESVPSPAFDSPVSLDRSCMQDHNTDHVNCDDSLEERTENRITIAYDSSLDSKVVTRPQADEYVGKEQDAFFESNLSTLRIGTKQRDCYQSALHENMERAGVGIPWSAVFNRLARDGELHRDQLPEALELGAMEEVTERHINYALGKLTKYTTLNLEEFERFIELYIETLRQEHLAIFEDRDVNEAGLVDITSLTDWLEEVDIKPMRHVLAEILEDLGAAECKALDFTQFEKLLETIKLREGFSKFEFNRIIGAFDMYDLDRSGTLDVGEIAAVLDHLFYSLDRRTAIRIVQDTDLDGSGTIGMREFLVSMRKIREAEVDRISKCIMARKLPTRRTARVSAAEIDPSKEDCHLEGIMYMLGYVPDYEALTEAAREVGLDVPAKNLQLCDAWKFLEVYRAREGFTQNESDDIKEIFEQFSTVEDNELKMLKHNLDIALRFLGYNASREVRSMLFRDADLDNSGSLGCTEFKTIVRKFREMELAQVRATMKEVGQKHNRSELCDETVDMMKELRDLRRKRKSFRYNEGYSPFEVELFEAMFKSYDYDGGGSLTKGEMRMLFENIIPELATSQKQRPILVRLLSEVDDGDCQLNFREFLGLMRRFDAINDEAHTQREEAVARDTEFCMQEIEQFRRLFVAADEGRKDHLSFEELRKLLSSVVPPGDRAVLKLRKLWHEVAPDADVDGLDFPAFLSLVKRLLDNPIVVKPLSPKDELYQSPLEAVAELFQGYTDGVPTECILRTSLTFMDDDVQRIQALVSSS